jgi:hypothetical protein
MLLLRAAFLGFLLCFHVIGAAVLFRRLFPRESPWLCFIIPPLALVVVLNFFEHYFSMPNFGWFLPLTVGGLLWAMARPGNSWAGLKLPTTFFLIIFSFVFLLRCLSPVIPNFTEGIFNMTRILNYCLSTTLPPKDCWLPPYDYGAYYTFQHYGASVLKRLFSVDLGTAYNLSFAFLLTWLCLAGVGVSYSMTGKVWIAATTAIVLLSGSTGLVPLLILFGHHGADYEVSISINNVWNDPDRNPFTWLCAHDSIHPVLKLLPPMYTMYYSEYHGNLGGAFVTIVAVLACNEVMRSSRSNWPWICSVALPLIAVITSAWFFFIVCLVSVGGMMLALIAGRRPENWKFVCVGGSIALVCLWPAFYSLSGNPAGQAFAWSEPDERIPFWMFAIQWWPVWIPWILLCFVWHKLDLMTRWMHVAVPIMLLGIEYCYFASYSLTVEKMWGGIYGIALVTILPAAFAQRNVIFRLVSVSEVFIFSLCLVTWMTIRYSELDRNVFFRLQGDSIVQNDHQSKRLLEVLRSLHGVIVLPGKSYWDYNPAPAVIGFSENYCYVAYFFQEAQIGHGEEADYRNKLNNEFYDGKMADPLPFLRANNIGAVLIWQEDNISDEQLQKFQQQIGSDYYYINCKVDQPNNAGVFIRQATTRTSDGRASTPPAPLELGPTPNPGS